MSKREMKPGNMVYPLPAALVSCIDKDGNTNLITIAWTGTICSDPAMLYISVRPERYSHHMLEETGEFVLNLTTEEIIRAVDTCGVKSGADVDKWKLTGLTPESAREVKAPLVKESPVSRRALYGSSQNRKYAGIYQGGSWTWPQAYSIRFLRAGHAEA